MAVMNGIKRAAVDCDLFQFSTFNAQRSTLNPSSASLRHRRHSPAA
jgi:hypothetical protein